MDRSERDELRRVDDTTAKIKPERDRDLEALEMIQSVDWNHAESRSSVQLIVRMCHSCSQVRF